MIGVPLLALALLVLAAGAAPAARAADSIYWTNFSSGAIRVGGLGGSPAASDLFTGESSPFGVAIDPAANRIYWANSSAIRVAGLGGSPAASNLFTGESNPEFPALLRSPAGAGAPEVSGGGQLGQALSCSEGAWAPNLLGAFLFRAPRSFAYQWQLNGADIAGAAASTYTPGAPGSYACRVTASNQAGSASQASAPMNIAGPAGSAAGEDPKCKHLRRKHRRQRHNLSRTVLESKRSEIKHNLKDTTTRLKKLAC
jgi:hypothetical protein